MLLEKLYGGGEFVWSFLSFAGVYLLLENLYTCYKRADLAEVDLLLEKLYGGGEFVWSFLSFAGVYLLLEKLYTCYKRADLSEVDLFGPSYRLREYTRYKRADLAEVGFLCYKRRRGPIANRRIRVQKSASKG